MIVHIVEGWTERLEFLLLSDGEAPGVPLTGTAELVLKDNTGTAVDTAGDVAILDAPTWRVGYTPDAADMTAALSPYTLHWKVTQGGATFFFPSGPADLIRVYRP